MCAAPLARNAKCKMQNAKKFAAQFCILHFASQNECGGEVSVVERDDAVDVGGEEKGFHAPRSAGAKMQNAKKFAAQFCILHFAFCICLSKRLHHPLRPAAHPRARAVRLELRPVGERD